MLSVGAIILLLLLITLLLVVTITWSSYPVAKFVKINRNDSEQKYIVIGDIEVIDTKGNKVTIMNIEGSEAETYGNSTATLSTASDATPLTTGVLFINNGVITKGYAKVDGGSTTAVGPAMGALRLSKASNQSNFILYVLSCPTKIAKINITAVPGTVGETAARNLQNVKVSLLDNDRNLIKGSEKIIPVAVEPRSIHHFTYG